MFHSTEDLSAVIYSCFGVFCPSSYHALLLPALAGEPGRLSSLAGCEQHSSVQVRSRQWLPHCQKSSTPLPQAVWQKIRLPGCLCNSCSVNCKENFIFLQGWALGAGCASPQQCPAGPQNSADTRSSTSLPSHAVMRGSSPCSSRDPASLRWLRPGSPGPFVPACCPGWLWEHVLCSLLCSAVATRHLAAGGAV